MTQRAPRSISEIIGLWASFADCAADLGKRYKEHQPRDWAKRGSLPSEHIAPLVRAAQAAGHKHITCELVADICAKQGARKRAA